MELAPHRLAAALAAEPPRPVYLVAGAEPLRVQEACDAIRSRVREAGYDERLIHDAGGRDFDWQTVSADFGALSLFSQRRLFEVRLSSGKPGKPGAEFLRGYCAAPPPDTVLLIVADEWSKSHAGAWSEAIAATGHVVICWPVKSAELPEWLASRARSAGIRLTADAIALLAERVEGNLLAADQEIRKLALQLEPGSTLDGPGLAAVIADAARFDVFRLFDAALAGEAARVARILAGLRAEGAQIPQLMGWIGAQMLLLARVAGTLAAGGDAGETMRKHGLWPARQNQFRVALKRHPGSRWDAFVGECGRIDQAAKGRLDLDPWVRLERLLIAVADPKAVRLLAA